MLDLIYDRTDADVSRVLDLTQKLASGTATDDEKTEWFAGMKGAYNASDLNRVGAAVAYLTGVLLSDGYYTLTAPKTDWTTSDTPTQAQMQQYIADIHTLRDRLPYIAPDAPDTASKLTFQQANAIEEILHTLETVLISMQESYKLKQANTLFMTAGGILNA